MKFDNILDLKTTFKKGDMKFVDTITVAGAEYRLLKSTEYSILDMIEKGHKGLVIYSLRKKDDNVDVAKEAGLHEWILFLWGFDKSLRMVPYDVRSTTGARVRGAIVKENYKEISQDRIIPDIVKVLLIDLPVANTLTGKVDTGADICSLHAENIQIDRGNQTVSFNCPPLSQNRFTMPLADQQAVRVPSSEKTVYRPVITLNMKVADKGLENIEVNLNDRSNMEHPFLVGQNALEAGNFIIDPNIIKDSLEIDDVFELLAEEFSDEIVEEHQSVDPAFAAQMFDIFEQADLTMSELIKILRAEAVNRLKDLDY